MFKILQEIMCSKNFVLLVALIICGATALPVSAATYTKSQLQTLNDQQIGKVVNVNGAALFVSGCYNCSSGKSLYRTDGTISGTTIIKNDIDILKNSIFSRGNLAYFFARTGNQFDEINYGLWKTDGTIAGTSLVSPLPSGLIENTAVFNGDMFYFALSGFSSNRNVVAIWKTDGTQSGTTEVYKSYNLESLLDFFGNPVSANDSIYFLKRTTGSKLELWKTNGTNSNTVKVLDLPDTVDFVNDRMPQSLISDGSNVYFLAGKQLWKVSNDVAAVFNSCDANGYGVSGYMGYLGEYKANHYFYCHNVDYTYVDLWRTDKYSSVEISIKRLPVPVNGHDMQGLGSSDTSLYFMWFQDQTPSDANHTPIWRTDGTSEGTIFLTDAGSLVPHFLFEKNTTPFFIQPNDSSGFSDWNLVSLNNSKNGFDKRINSLEIASNGDNVRKGLYFNGVYVYPGVYNYRDSLIWKISDENSNLCGNGQLDSGEVCDSSNLNNQTCASQGFGGGTLKCASDCKSFDTSACTMTLPDLTIEDIKIENNLVKAYYCNRGADPVYNPFGVSIPVFYVKITANNISHDGLLNGAAAYIFSIPKANTCTWTDGYPTSFYNISSGSYSATAIADWRNDVTESNKNNNTFTKNVTIGSANIKAPISCSDSLSDIDSSISSYDTLASLKNAKDTAKLGKLVDYYINNYGGKANGKEFNLPNTYGTLIGKCTWMEHYDTKNCYVYSYKTGSKVSDYTDQSCDDVVSGRSKMIKAIMDGYCCDGAIKKSTPVTCDGNLADYAYLTGFNSGETLISIINDDTKLKSLVHQVLNNKAQISGLTGRRLATNQVPSTNEKVLGECKWLDHWDTGNWYVYSYKTGSKVSAYADVDYNQLAEGETRMVKAIKDNYCCSANISGSNCGNGQLDSGEVCDGNNLNNQTCQNRGYNSGALKCASNCLSFDISNCQRLNNTSTTNENKQTQADDVNRLIAAKIVENANNTIILKLNRMISNLEQKVVDLETRLTGAINGVLANKLKGQLLIQPESDGEVWYTSPDTGERFYVANGQAAYGILSGMGKGITNKDLQKIAIGYDPNLYGGLTDTDGDGLPDVLEQAIGTNINNTDTDGDGYNDLAEAVGGYNPNGAGKMPINSAFAKKLKGIYLDVDNRGAAWYINPRDFKRYYVSPETAYNVMKYLSLGVSNNNLRQIPVGQVSQ